MRTVGHRFSGQRGDATAHCSQCGVRWYTSELRRDASGAWVCPDDAAGRDEVTLDRLNAASADSFAKQRTKNKCEAPYYKTEVEPPGDDYDNLYDI